MTELYQKLKEDLADLDFQAINDLLLLQQSKAHLVKKRGIHDVLSGRIDELVKEEEALMTRFLEDLSSSVENKSEKQLTLFN